jgi:DUF1680 family protein
MKITGKERFLATVARAKDMSAPEQSGGQHVIVGGEFGRRISITITNNLLKLDIEKDFIAPLREKTGAFTGVGALLNAASLLAAQTSDQRVVCIRDEVAEAVLALQEPDGYIGSKTGDKRVWEAFDVDEGFQILTGLLTHHRTTGCDATLAGARRLALFVREKFCNEPEEAMRSRMLCDTLMFLGLELGQLDLHSVTGDAACLEFIELERQLAQWRAKIVQGRWGSLEGHAYAHLVKCLAQLRLHRIAPENSLLDQTHAVMEFLTRENGMVITGAVSDWECWHDSQEGGWNLGETCANAYLLYVLDDLVRIESNGLHGDLMERIVLNTLFAAQSPDGRQLRYNTAFEGPRTYYLSDAYCCPNNYRLAMGRLPTLIYHRMDNIIRVNLYTTSSATFHLPHGRLTLEQITDYPNSGNVVIRISLDVTATFTLSLRLPRWCESPSVEVAGKPLEAPLEPGSFFPINRTWRNGDEVSLNLPMKWRFIKGRRAQSGRIAIMRGPQLFTLSRSGNADLAPDARLTGMYIDPATITGPFPDRSVRPDGMACRVKAWIPGEWTNVPFAEKKLTLTLTEFADPTGEAIYFKTPNPSDHAFEEDELLRGPA